MKPMDRRVAMLYGRGSDPADVRRRLREEDEISERADRLIKKTRCLIELMGIEIREAVKDIEPSSEHYDVMDAIDRCVEVLRENEYFSSVFCDGEEEGDD